MQLRLCHQLPGVSATPLRLKIGDNTTPMTLKKVEMTGNWNQNIPLWVIAGHFLILYPITQLYLRDYRWLSQYGYSCFQALALVIFIRMPRLKHLGWTSLYLRQNFLIGGACGLTIIATLPLLDLFAQQHSLVKSQAVWQVETLVPILLLPLLEQSFFSGFISQSLLKRLNPILAIYLSAAVFTLAHFTLSLGTFFLGFIATGLYYMTGTLIAPLIFHVSCQLAGVLLTHAYPHLATFLGFLL